MRLHVFELLVEHERPNLSIKHKRSRSTRAGL